MKNVTQRRTRWWQLALPALLAPALAHGQVALYNFTQSTETYTEIGAADGGVVLGAPAPAGSQTPNNPKAYLDPLFPGGIGQNNLAYFTDYSGTLRSGFPIGFNFTYNGEVFDRIAISEVGWISFGKSSDGTEAVWCYANNDNGPAHGDPFVQTAFTPPGPVPDYKRNRVAGFGNGGLRMRDWSASIPPGPVSSLRMATIGTAPNRVCVVQWKDFSLSGDYAISYNSISFQIRLNESDNSVDVRFGPMNWDHLLTRRKDTQIGLSGRNSEDFNGRKVVYEQPAFLYDWSNTTAVLPADTALDNMVYCHMESPEMGQPNGSGVPPVVGLNWHWVAPFCPPPSWPATIADITFDGANATWGGTAAGTYEYLLTTTNAVTGPVTASGTTTDTQIAFEELEASTTYYLFIRSICGGVPGVWSAATVFTTIGGAVIQCDGTAVEDTYCSHQNSVKDWLYVSSDGSPLKIEYMGGYVGNISGGHSLQAWSAGTPGGQPAPFSPAVGDVTGQEYLSGSQMYIRLTTDQGACDAQEWYLPLHWRIGCKSCTDPLVSFQTGTTDCANQQYFVNANVFSLGSASSISMENNLGLPPTVVSTSGNHSVGPFPVGQGVVITAQNPDNAMCYITGQMVINEPCPVQDCGPATYTACYGNDEMHQWAYQGTGSQQVGIRFLGGTVGWGDQGEVYDGLDLQGFPVAMPGSTDLTNKLYTSSTSDHALVMQLTSDHTMSCTTPDVILGSSTPWKWVVACYDGCTQPHATFASNCISSTQFEVQVNISEIGSTGSVNISNDGGAAPVSASAAGVYTVGPFPAGIPVTLNVVGASALCTWTSYAINPDCSNVGISEESPRQMSIYPNPSNGSFQVELPNGMEGRTDLVVMDVTGRVVHLQAIATRTATMDLGHLPNGLYTMVARNGSLQTTSKISIQH